MTSRPLSDGVHCYSRECDPASSPPSRYLSKLQQRTAGRRLSQTSMCLPKQRAVHSQKKKREKKKQIA
jgi:hypothetical protein